MKNRIYPFLLGLSCIVIVALVSFKNSENAVEKEQMLIVTSGIGGSYDIHISTANSYESINIQENDKGKYNYLSLLKKIEEYQKAGWIVTNSNHSHAGQSSAISIYYTLERDKK